MSEVTLPWPPKALSANSRKQHRYSTDDRKAYKETCWKLGKEAKFHATHLDITFCPPDARRRDTDNLIASIKYGLDGLALAMGVDDQEFNPITARRGKPMPPHGCVIIRDGGRAND